MANTGATLPGTGSNVTGVGTIAWSNPGNITGIGGGTATFTGSNVTSNYLQASNFGFSIPGGATIDGVVALFRRSTNGDDGVTDNIIRLVKGGVISGSNKSTGATWATPLTNVTFGSSSDLWGTTLSTTDINSSNFGVVISAIIPFGFTGDLASVDYVQMTIYYTGGSATANSGMFMAF